MGTEYDFVMVDEESGEKFIGTVLSLDDIIKGLCFKRDHIKAKVPPMFFDYAAKAVYYLLHSGDDSDVVEGDEE